MSDTLPGVLLLHADVKTADAWVRHGVVPAYVLPLSGWAAVVPAGFAQAKEPYRDGVQVLANRQLPGRSRPALGFYAMGKRAVVVVHPRGWRAVTRYVVWMPSHGAVRAPGIPLARPADLVRAAGVERAAEREVRDLLTSTGGSATDLLRSLMRALALPGDALLTGEGVKTDDESILVEPRQSAVDRFDKVVTEDAEITAELEEHS